MTKEFDYYFKDMTRGMEDHQFRHYNRALGMYIESKEQYIRELKRRNLVPLDMAESQCEQWRKKNPHKDYVLSDRAKSLINHFKNSAKNGYIKLSDYPKAVKELKEMGIDFERNIEEFIAN